MTPELEAAYEARRRARMEFGKAALRLRTDQSDLAADAANAARLVYEAAQARVEELERLGTKKPWWKLWG